MLQTLCWRISFCFYVAGSSKYQPIYLLMSVLFVLFFSIWRLNLWKYYNFLLQFFRLLQKWRSTRESVWTSTLFSKQRISPTFLLSVRWRILFEMSMLWWLRQNGLCPASCKQWMFALRHSFLWTVTTHLKLTIFGFSCRMHCMKLILRATRLLVLWHLS